MCTLYYHAGASAAAAGRGLGVLDVRGDDRGRVFAAADAGGGALAPCRSPASRTPALADFLFSRFNFTSTLLQLYFQFYGKLPSRRFFSGHDVFLVFG